jgi:AcrR family transcriptional regulator
MARSEVVPVKKLGRPPATDSADTRQRILDLAREAFATGGYDAATNRSLADDVGITSGALYHYFGSKLDLYLAVNEDMQDRVFVRFSEAVEQQDGFVAKFEAILDTAQALNKEDPTLAAFIGSTRSDVRRHGDIAEVLVEQSARQRAFFARLVDTGVETGEIPAEYRDVMLEFVTMILVGLTDGVSHDHHRHQLAITSVKMMLRGELVVQSPS